MAVVYAFGESVRGSGRRGTHKDPDSYVASILSNPDLARPERIFLLRQYRDSAQMFRDLYVGDRWCSD